MWIEGCEYIEDKDKDRRQTEETKQGEETRRENERIKGVCS